MKFLAAATLLASLASASIADPLPRRVTISGTDFVDESGKTIVLAGPNIVVKGPPYLPRVEGDDICNDVTSGPCRDSGTCTTCYTFNSADIAHLKSLGWNTIRLGVVWAGAQTSDSDSLDPDFLERLHAVLDLTDKEGIHVVLDNHGDMVGTAGCGNGAPMWFQQKAAPELIGKPLSTGFPYNLVPSLKIKDLEGYDTCGDDEEKWAKFAGDPLYNIKNECCMAMNSPNPGALGYTKISQKTMDYMLKEGPGRDDFVRYWKLMAEAVVDHPSAIAVEQANEPMSIRRREMFETWRAVAEAVNGVIPDMSVSLSDVGEGALLPAWVSKIVGAGISIKKETIDWIKSSNNLYYAWHWYGQPKNVNDAVKNAQEIMKEWNVPSFATEFGDCAAWDAADAAGISHSYWHYSSYCDTGPAFGNKTVGVDETFGACILGWAGADSTKCVH